MSAVGLKVFVVLGDPPSVLRRGDEITPGVRRAGAPVHKGVRVMARMRGVGGGVALSLALPAVAGAATVFGTGTASVGDFGPDLGQIDIFTMDLVSVDPSTQTLDVSITNTVGQFISGFGVLLVSADADLGGTYVDGKFIGSGLGVTQTDPLSGMALGFNDTVGSTGLSARPNAFVPGSLTASGSDYSGPLVVGFSPVDGSSSNGRFALNAGDLTDTVIEPTASLGSVSGLGGLAYDPGAGVEYRMERIDQTVVRLTATGGLDGVVAGSVDLSLPVDDASFGAIGLTFLPGEGLLFGSTTSTVGTTFFAVDPSILSAGGLQAPGTAAFFVSDTVAEGAYISGLGAVPAPGVVGLLGVAGVAGLRRRRG